MSVADPAVRVVTPDGHSPARWEPRLARVPRTDLAALAALVGGGPAGEPRALVVVSAHPDDETIGSGRLVYDWGRQVGPVYAMVATDGEACVDHLGRRPDGLAARRIGEWHEALDRLGVRERRALHLPDGALADHEGELADAVERLVHDLGAGPVALAAPYRSDPHPDHAAAGRAASRAAAATRRLLLEYPVWMTYWCDPGTIVPDADLMVLACSAEADRAHEEACAMFRSQLEPLSENLTPVVPPQMLDHHQRQLVVLTASASASASVPARAAAAGEEGR